MASLFTDRAIRYPGNTMVLITLRWLYPQEFRRWFAQIRPLPELDFTILPDTGYEKVIFLTGSWGLGDNVVAGGGQCG